MCRGGDQFVAAVNTGQVRRRAKMGPRKGGHKAASHARWLTAPENQTCFCGPIHVARVRAWRSRHPGYWRRGEALQGLSIAQGIDSSILRWKRAISRTLRYKSS